MIIIQLYSLAADQLCSKNIWSQGTPDFDRRNDTERIDKAPDSCEFKYCKTCTRIWLYSTKVNLFWRVLNSMLSPIKQKNFGLYSKRDQLAKSCGTAQPISLLLRTKPASWAISCHLTEELECHNASSQTAVMISIEAFCRLRARGSYVHPASLRECRGSHFWMISFCAQTHAKLLWDMIRSLCSVVNTFFELPL